MGTFLRIEKLGERPELRAKCLALVERWLLSASHASSRTWLETWGEMLATWSLERIAEAILDPISGQTLRQCSPLGPALTPRERWQALAEVEREIDEGRGRATA